MGVEGSNLSCFYTSSYSFSSSYYHPLPITLPSLHLPSFVPFLLSCFLTSGTSHDLAGGGGGAGLAEETGAAGAGGGAEDKGGGAAAPGGLSAAEKQPEDQEATLQSGESTCICGRACLISSES